MNEFKNYHPLVNFVYFAFVIAFSMFFMNPICLAVNSISGVLYSISLREKRQISAAAVILTVFGVALINPLFNHEGVTILFYLPSGNSFTLESVLYGVGAAVMILSVILYFSCFNFVMTSDKIMYLVGKLSAALPLVFSMALRLVPRIARKTREISEARKNFFGESGSGIIPRAKEGIRVLSVITTWSFENSVDTADSMRGRGFGIRKRTYFSNYHMTGRDRFILILILLFGIMTAVAVFSGSFYFRYFPKIKYSDLSLMGMIGIFSYAILCMIPFLLEVREKILWKNLK